MISLESDFVLRVYDLQSGEVIKVIGSEEPIVDFLVMETTGLDVVAIDNRNQILIRDVLSIEDNEREAPSHSMKAGNKALKKKGSKSWDQV